MKRLYGLCRRRYSVKRKFQTGSERLLQIDKDPLGAFKVMARSQCRQDINFFTYYCATNSERISNDVVVRMMQYTKNALHSLDAVGNAALEAKVTCMIRVLEQRGRMDEALSLVHTLTSKYPGVEIRIRTLSPLLIKYAEENKVKMIESLLEIVDAERIALSEKELCPVADVLLQHGRRDLLMKIVKTWQDNYTVLSTLGSVELGKVFEKHGCKVSSKANIRHNGQCTHCNHHMDQVLLTEQQLGAMQVECLRILQTTSSEINLSEFRKWILRDTNGKPHAIIDGPNVALHIFERFTGLFRYDLVEMVKRRLEEEGYFVSIILPNRHTNPQHSSLSKAVNLPPKILETHYKSSQDIIEQWKSTNQLYIPSDDVPDDIVWIYGSLLLGESSKVLTFDQMRDHFSIKKLSSNKILTRELLHLWRTKNVLQFTVQHNFKPGQVSQIHQIHLIHPPSYSRYVSIEKDKIIHFPTNDHCKWLCVHL